MLVGKAELERRYVVAFLESIGQPAEVSPLPAGTGPDFAASLDIGVVGVEVTRLYRDDEEHGVPHGESEGR